jgi:hypothetical protein
MRSFRVLAVCVAALLGVASVHCEPGADSTRYAGPVARAEFQSCSG